MSSILKALKKVEVETIDKDSVLSWPHGLDTRAALRRSVRARRFSFAAVGLVLALGCVVAIGMGWYIGSDQTQVSDKDPAGDPQLTPSRTSSQAAGIPATVKGKPEQAAAGTARRQPVRTDTARRQRKVRPEGVPRSVKPAAAKRNPVQPDSKPASAGSQARSQTPLLPAERGKLTLQAISWAPNMDARIAVINGQIVREGGAVEGFTISKINPDEVFVRSGSDEWRLVFGHQSP